MLSLALYQPDIPQNTGAMIRLAACLGLKFEIIEPCSFPWNITKLKRGGLDYLDKVEIIRHIDWPSFQAAHQGQRIVLLTTKTDAAYYDFSFKEDDVLLCGSESSGVPQHVHDAADARITIPMKNDMRSLNVATSAAMVAGEALRQLGIKD